MALDHAPVILLNAVIILQYLIIIANMVQWVDSCHVLCCRGRGGLSALADEECEARQVIQVALASLQETRPMLM